jgi:hypothetical protein
VYLHLLHMDVLVGVDEADLAAPGAWGPCRGPWRGVRQQQQQHVAGSMGGSEKVATSRKGLGEAGAAEGGPWRRCRRSG